MITYALSGCAVFHVKDNFFWGGMYVTCNASLFMQLLSETHLHQGRTQHDIKTYLGFHAKLQKFLSILAKLEFSPKILIQLPNIKFHNNHLAGDTHFHTDRWTVMTKPIIHFCNFANVPRLVAI